jgi:hypothetical protein
MLLALYTVGFNIKQLLQSVTGSKLSGLFNHSLACHEVEFVGDGFQMWGYYKYIE